MDLDNHLLDTEAGSQLIKQCGGFWDPRRVHRRRTTAAKYVFVWGVSIHAGAYVSGLSFAPWWLQALTVAGTIAATYAGYWLLTRHH